MIMYDHDEHVEKHNMIMVINMIIERGGMIMIMLQDSFLSM
jgi:hypothetical protein